ncbi:MAG: FkbM family methyltransferase, partial [Candidatus Binatus sp.]
RWTSRLRAREFQSFMSVFTSIVGMMPHSWIKAVSNASWRHPAVRRAFEWSAKRIQGQAGKIRQGVGKGLLFNPGGSNAGYLLGTSEPGVQRAMLALLRPGMTFFDVGANVGFHSTLACLLIDPSRGHVVSFEPLTANADQIEVNARLNHFDSVQVMRVALGNYDGEARFLLSEISSRGALETTGRIPSSPAGTARVRIRRLDTLMSEAHLPPPDVMKIDVEGAEADVLAGAHETLMHHRPILMIELHGTNAEVASALDAIGYRTSVLGRTGSIAEVPWDSYIIARPAERADLAACISSLSMPTVESR